VVAALEAEAERLRREGATALFVSVDGTAVVSSRSPIR